MSMIDGQGATDTPMSARDVVLSPSQEAGYRVLMHRMSTGERLTTLVGYAGTGKTTLVRAVLRAVGASRPVVLTAVTGKAVLRMVEVLSDLLRPSEMPGPEGSEASDPVAMTLHGLCYRTKRDLWSCPSCSHTFPEPTIESSDSDLSTAPCPACGTRLDPEGRAGPRPGVRPGFGDPDCSETVAPNALVIIDEASMVGAKLRGDVEKAFRSLPGVQFLILGDSGQIPPVGDTPGYDFNAADVTLTEIHRAEASNPIIRLTSELRRPRTQNPWDIVAPNPSDSRYSVSRPGATPRYIGEWYAERYRHRVDVTLLTFANDTRFMLNRAVRQACGVPVHGGADLLPGESLLVLRNHAALGMMNGEVLRVLEVQPYPTADAILPQVPPGSIVGARVTSPTRPEPRWVSVCTDLFGRKEQDAVFQQRRTALERWFQSLLRGQKGQRAKEILLSQLDGHLPTPDNLIFADYGYCLTVHKAQGSEWSEVGIAWDRSMTWSYRKPDGHKLVYTALTRARRTTTIFRMES